MIMQFSILIYGWMKHHGAISWSVPYIGEKLSKISKSWIWKLSQNYRYRKMPKIWADIVWKTKLISGPLLQETVIKRPLCTLIQFWYSCSLFQSAVSLVSERRSISSFLLWWKKGNDPQNVDKKMPASWNCATTILVGGWKRSPPLHRQWQRCCTFTAKNREVIDLLLLSGT